MKVKTATGYDSLFPKTTAEQVITNSSKRFTSDTEMNEKQAASITLADSAGSTTLPAVASGTIPSKIQALRDNIKALFGYFSNGIANKATQDSTGQQINTTYIKGLSVSGKTVTYTKGDGSTGTITTQDTVNSYTLPTANASALGGVKLSDSTSLTSGVSGGVAATPTAVKAAYDLANTSNTSVNDLQAVIDAMGYTKQFTSSTTWTAPYTGLYEIILQNGGQGGQGRKSEGFGNPGSGGACTIAIYKLTANTTYGITVGAGGAGGTEANITPGNGGVTSISNAGTPQSSYSIGGGNGFEMYRYFSITGNSITIAFFAVGSSFLSNTTLISVTQGTSIPSVGGIGAGGSPGGVIGGYAKYYGANGNSGICIVKYLGGK